MLDQSKIKDEVVEVRKQEQQKEDKYLGTMRFRRGHTLFSFNKNTGEIKEAIFATQEYVVGQPKPNRRVNVEKDCMYIGALNKKNLYKKLAKAFPGKIEEIKKVNNYGK